MADDEWLRDAIHDAERARASERAKESKQQAREAATAASAARNAEVHAVAVERVQTAIKHVRRVLAENSDRGMVLLFRQPNFLRRPVYGWHVNLPPGGGPVLHFEYSQEKYGRSWPSTMRGQLNGLPEYLGLVKRDGFSTDRRFTRSGPELFTDREFVDLILPTRAVVSDGNDDRSGIMLADIFPVIGEEYYKGYVQSIARGLSASLIGVLQKQNLPLE
jgi:hypothetical protein